MGILRPGEYTVEFSKAWGDGMLLGQEGLIVEPGSTVDQVIAVPRKMLERVAVRIRFTLPEDLKKEGLVLEAPFYLRPNRESSVSWSVSHRWTSGKSEESAPFAYSPTRPVLVSPSPSVPGHDRPAVAEIFNALAGLYLWSPRGTQDPRASVLAKDVHSIDLPEPALLWERGSYSLSSLLVLRPLADSGGKGAIRHFAILADAQRYAGMGTTYEIQDGPPSVYTVESTQRIGVSGVVALNGIRLTDEYWSRLDENLQARPGEVNEWTIPLPEELIQAVRAKLKAPKP